MVLSHKKLKQKLRALVTECLAADESNDPRKDVSSVAEVNHELQSVRELLATKSRRPKPQRKKEKNKTSPEDLMNEDGCLVVHEGNTSFGENLENEGLVDLKERVKVKKRKRGDSEGQELVGGLQKKKQKLEKKKKKKQQLEKKKKKRRELKLKRKGKEGTIEKDGALEKEETKHGDAIQRVLQQSKMPQVVASVQVDEIEKKKVYVGGIPYYSSEDDIRNFFQDCGTITEMDCMTFPETRKFRGIAILSFKVLGSSPRAFAMDGADMGGFYLKIQPYKASRTQRSSDFAPEIIDGYNRVYVGNLSWDITEDALKQFFSDCRILSVRFGTDKETGDFKGYAHIDFSDSVSLAIALKLDQRVLCGRPVRVRCAVPRKSVQTESISKSGDKMQNGGHLVVSSSSASTCAATATAAGADASVSACANASVSWVLLLILDVWWSTASRGASGSVRFGLKSKPNRHASVLVCPNGLEPNPIVSVQNRLYYNIICCCGLRERDSSHAIGIWKLNRRKGGQIGSGGIAGNRDKLSQAFMISQFLSRLLGIGISFQFPHSGIGNDGNWNKLRRFLRSDSPIRELRSSGAASGRPGTAKAQGFLRSVTPIPRRTAAAQPRRAPVIMENRPIFLFPFRVSLYKLHMVSYSRFADFALYFHIDMNIINSVENCSDSSSSPVEDDEFINPDANAIITDHNVQDVELVTHLHWPHSY
ncbi:hypothetical protein KSP40_PGU020173 [Platanthera guangdongensis]|uniref:RRM domain-containing protein n=1 Tax=Platanthera guangdongensis TaxID=2320717 RepID=A0ABR2LU04_9ASPA